MYTYYRKLGVSPDAGDEEIRRQFLEQVSAYPPETHPERFKEISDAYERIKDRRSRIRTRLFAFLEAGDVDAALDGILGDVSLKRRRPRLDEILKIESVSVKTGGNPGGT